MFKKSIIALFVMSTVMVAPAQASWYVHVQADDGYYGWMISDTLEDSTEWAFKRCQEASAVPDTCAILETEERE